MDERYFNYTSCIRSQNINAITEIITNILEQEKGCQRLLRLPELAFDVEKLNSLKIWERSRLWVIGLFCGEEGWTIIKTYPAEFLCTRKTNSDRPRLSELAVQLRCDAFHYRAVRDLDGILMEADSRGQIFVSGSNDHEGDYSDDEQYQFYQEQINESSLYPQKFSLIEVSESIQAAMLVNEDPEIERKEAEYEKLMVDNTLDPDAHFEAMTALVPLVLQGYAERIDIALGGIINPSESFFKSFWYKYDLLYSAYIEAQELEKKGIKLLYFQPPITTI
jgi:hypothetical protein